MKLEKDYLEKLKITIEIIAIVLAGLFAAWKWGIEAYWSREDNYRAYFKDLSQEKQAPFYVKVDYKTSDDYLTVSGEVVISNHSAAPIHIEKTFLYFIPFSYDKCDPLGTSPENINKNDCIKSSTTSSIFDQECNLDTSCCKTEFKTEILPIDKLPLFGKSDANRPFNVRLPVKYFSSKKGKKGLFIIAEQEVGDACLKGSLIKNVWDSILLRKCNTSRALTVYPKLP